jgi:hemerythrin-like domain-containing protein
MEHITKIKYYHILENGETRILKTNVSQVVLDLMFSEYKDYYKRHPKKEDLSFWKFLQTNGISAIYDETFGFLDTTI